MNNLIQYQDETNIWSDWISAIIDTQNNQIRVNNKCIQSPYFRVLDCNNCSVSWYAVFQGNLYQIDKNHDGFISEAIPFDAKLNLIPAEDISSEFTTEAYKLMFESAFEFLQPPLFMIQDIQCLLRESNEPSESQITGPAREWLLKLGEKYRLDVEQNLINIIENNKSRKKQNLALKEYLKKNYYFIQGSCLDYLAQPNSVPTNAMIHIANKIAPEENLTPIEILMPDIATDSSKDNYPDLNTLSLHEVISTHHYINKNFLLPVSMLADYINEPTEIFYLPYCKDGEYKIASLINILGLFNHSEETKLLNDIFKSYTALTHNQSNLLGQLKFLVQQLKRFDAHTGSGQQHNAAGGAYPAILNFLKYYRQLEPCYFLIINDKPQIEDIPPNYQLSYAVFNQKLYFLNRRTNHVKLVAELNQPAKFPIHISITNDFTQIEKPAIIKTSNGYHFLQDNNPPVNLSIEDVSGIQNFFQERPKQLNEAMIPNKVFQSIPSIETLEKLLTKKLPSAKELSDEDLFLLEIQTGHSYMSGYTHVPESLRMELQLLCDIFYNPQKNINATLNIATCIGTRGEEIQKLIKKFETELIDIGVTSEQKKQLLEELKHQIDLQLELIKSKNFKGQDQNLGYKPHILEKLDHKVILKHYSELKFLNYFNKNDLEAIFIASTDLTNNILNILRDNNNLIIKLVNYIFETPVDIIEIILSKIVPKFSQSEKEQFISILINIPLNKEQFLSVAKAFIETIDDYKKIVFLLDIEKASYMFDIFNENLLEMISSTQDFIDILAHLNIEKQHIFIETMKEKFTKIIKNTRDLRDILQHLPKEQKITFYRNYKDQLPLIIENINDFKDISLILNSEEYQNFCDLTLRKIPYLIKNAEDFNKIMSFLNLKNQNKIINDMQSRFSELCLTSINFENIIKYRNSEQKFKIMMSIKQKLPELIETNKLLIFILKNLHSHQRRIIFTIISNNLPQIIDTSIDVISIFNLLDINEYSLFLDIIKSKLSSIINSMEDFRKIFILLMPMHHEQYYFIFKDKILELIKTPRDLRLMILSLKPHQFVEVFPELLRKLPEIINNAADFTQFSVFLKPNEFIQVCYNCKSNPNFLINLDNLLVLSTNLEKDFFDIVCYIFKDKLPELIKTDIEMLNISSISNQEIILKNLYLNICENYLENLKNSFHNPFAISNRCDTQISENMIIINQTISILYESTLNEALQFLDSKKPFLSQIKNSWLEEYTQATLANKQMIAHQCAKRIKGITMTTSFQFFHSLHVIGASNIKDLKNT